MTKGEAFILYTLLGIAGGVLLGGLLVWAFGGN